MAANTEPVMALNHIDQFLGGMMTAEVEAVLRSEPLLGNPLSICDLIDALPGNGEASTRMSMLELLPPQLKRAFCISEQNRAVVRFRLQDIGIASYGPVFERVQTQLGKIEARHDEFRLELVGHAVNRWQNLYRIVVDLAFCLGTASLIIFVVLTIVYRSLRLGLISVIPNLFPLAMTGFLLWVFGQSLEIVSVCAFTVCLGIAVDDTIHFLTRYREKQSVGVDRRQTIRRSFIGVGTALIITTMVLIIGFSTVLLSDSRDHRIFAIMGILTSGSALFADLVFLPALLLRFGGIRKSVVSGNGENDA